MYSYSVTDLGGLVPGATCHPLGISPQNQRITGNVETPDSVDEDSAPFLVGDLPFRALPDLPAFEGGGGFAVNSQGDVTGFCAFSPAQAIPAHAFLKPNNASLIDLHQLLPDAVEIPGSYAFGINEAGDVVGYHFLPGPLKDPTQTNAWLYTGGVMSNLTSMNSAILEARAINNVNQVLGALSSLELFVYDYVAKTLSPLAVTVERSTAYYINDAGQIAATLLNGAAIIQKNGVVLTYANQYLDMAGINASGQIACGDNADVFVSDPVSPAATKAPALYSLNSLLSTPDWVITKVTGIDDGGAIIGIGRQSGGEQRGVLLTPDSPFARVALMAPFVQILFGIINDAPGFQIPGGHIDPGGPGGPIWRALSTGQQDAVVGLAINAGASLISDRAARRNIQESSAALIRGASGRLNAATLSDRPSGQLSTRAAAHARRTAPANIFVDKNPIVAVNVEPSS